MRFDDYVAARRTRLLEHAVDEGCDPAAAPALVDGVLERQRRRIERAEDPDPETYRAVSAALAPPRRRVPPAVVALGVAALALPLSAWAVLGAVTGEAEPRGPRVVVPSFYAQDAPDAGRALREAGLRVDRRTVAVCDPPGLVQGTTPGPGARVAVGSTVVVRSAAPGRQCSASADRTAGWDFLAFVRGGPAPRFAETVRVVLAGQETAVLGRAAVSDPARWAGIEAVAEGLDALTRDTTSYPSLVVREDVPPQERCGVGGPAAAGDRPALVLRVVARADPQDPCPLTVHLYRDADGVVDAVVVLPARRAPVE